jgi:hypothetical protein
MPEDADQQLMSFVNLLGIGIFSLVVVYHFVTATAKDATA